MFTSKLSKDGKKVILTETPQAALDRWKFDAEEDDSVVMGIEEAFEEWCEDGKDLSDYVSRYPAPGVIEIELP